MGATWGEHIKLTIFGESHGSAIGVVLDGLPPGAALDMDEILREMARRAPGGAEYATLRKESDIPQILSGVLHGRTTGAPLCAMLQNKDVRSGDYQTALLRPGHADMTAYYKYKGFADTRGGGHFSGRLTATLCFAGAVAKQLLLPRGIIAAARIASIAGIDDAPAPPGNLPQIARKPFPTADDAAGEAMRKAIMDAKAEGDSVGGIVEGVLLGVPPGWGNPFFGSCESMISSFLFSVPAVHGVEFGAGFSMAAMRGSEANDPLRLENGVITPQSNHAGGLGGGITNGMPILVRAAFRPTPTIGKSQQTVDIEKMENAEIKSGGRHDSCIVPRAVPVVEAVLALCALELLGGDKNWEE